MGVVTYLFFSTTFAIFSCSPSICWQSASFSCCNLIFCSFFFASCCFNSTVCPEFASEHSFNSSNSSETAVIVSSSSVFEIVICTTVSSALSFAFAILEIRSCRRFCFSCNARSSSSRSFAFFPPNICHPPAFTDNFE